MISPWPSCEAIWEGGNACYDYAAPLETIHPTGGSRLNGLVPKRAAFVTPLDARDIRATAKNGSEAFLVKDPLVEGILKTPTYAAYLLQMTLVIKRFVTLMH